MLNSPYKMIAANADKSTNITTNDVVELRKLILGIYSVLPNNDSWRFVPADFVFPDPTNPLASGFPEDKNVNKDESANFVGIKIGDVNNNVIPNSGRLAFGSPLPLRFGRTEVSSKPSDCVTVPVVYTGHETLECIQMGLRFDPAQLEWIGASQGDLPAWGEGNFGLTRIAQGEIRTLWLPSNFLDDEQRITKGKTLFYLSFRIKSTLKEGELPLYLDEAILPGRAWQASGLEHPLLKNTEPIERDADAASVLPGIRVGCSPNPSSGAFFFDLNAEKAGAGRLAVFSAFGQRLFVKDITFEAGQQTFHVPQAAQWAPGVYVWKMYVDGQKVQGQIIRQ